MRYKSRKCIKDEDSKVLENEEANKRRWRSYFHLLFGEDKDVINLGSLDKIEEFRKLSYYQRIRELVVVEILKKMKKGKTTWLDKIPDEVWKGLGKKG